MTDVYTIIAENMTDMRKQLEALKQDLAIAQQTRDGAQAASNADLKRRRTAEAKLAEVRRALSFLASVIKSGESWSHECENILRAALDD
jgi:hypothetical protein